jgi:hypothetical protein
MKTYEYYENIENRLENGEFVPENEIIDYLSVALDIPLEIMEARLKMLRGDELLMCPEDL